MRIFDKELKDKKINFEALEEYGFVLNGNVYIFEKYIMNNKFKVVVEIFNNKMMSKLIDVSVDDEYLMIDIINSAGEYVGNVKEEYSKIIDDILDKCTTNDIFKSRQSKEVIFYIKEKYNDSLEYLWKRFPKNAVARNKKNNKWYLAILTVSENKIDNGRDEEIEILDLLYQKEKIEDIVDNKRIFPGYHMNKKSWITIKLDESLSVEEIKKLIDNSYEISLKK